MAEPRTEKGTSKVAAEATKVDTEAAPDLDTVLLQIKRYLIARKTPADAWQMIRKCVEHGVGFPDVGRQPAQVTEDDRTQAIKDEPMPESKSGSAVTQQIKSAELRELLNTVVDNPEKWLSTPTVQFGGRKPIDLIGTAEEPKVFDLLHAVDQGLF